MYRFLSQFLDFYKINADDAQKPKYIKLWKELQQYMLDNAIIESIDTSAGDEINYSIIEDFDRERKKENRGGKREGAGAPTKKDKLTTKTIRLSQEHLGLVSDSGLKINEFVRALFDKELKAKKRSN